MQGTRIAQDNDHCKIVTVQAMGRLHQARRRRGGVLRLHAAKKQSKKLADRLHVQNNPAKHVQTMQTSPKHLPNT